MSYRLAAMASGNVSEAFLFRILPSENPPWPWPMWRAPLASWLQGANASELLAA